MKIFERAGCDSTGTQKPSWQPVEVDENTEEISHGHGQFGNQTEFRLAVRVGCRFFANQAQFLDARKIAEEVIARQLFGDALRLVSVAKLAVSNHDERAAIGALAKLEEEILG